MGKYSNQLKGSCIDTFFVNAARIHRQTVVVYGPDLWMRVKLYDDVICLEIDERMFLKKSVL